MIQPNLDDIEAVLDRANDDADRVSVYEYREALNALYRTAIRLLSEKRTAEWERDELKTRLAHYEDRGAEQALDALRTVADEIERGDHER